MSAPEAFGHRFDNKVRIAVMIITFIVTIVLLSIQPKAAAAMLAPMLGIDTNLMTAILAGLFLVCAITGMTGISRMNLVHSAVLIFGVVFVAIVCMVNIGGVSRVIETAPDSYWNIAPKGIPTIIAEFLGTVIGFGMSASPINSCFCSKSLTTARKGLVIAGLCVFVFSFGPLAIGAAGMVSLPNANAASILYLMPASISPWLAGIISIAVIAATFSSGPFFLLYLSTMITRDFAVPVLHLTSDKQQLNASRIAMVLCTILAIFLANHSGSIMQQLLGAMQVQAVEAIILIVSLVWPRMTNVGAFWGILAGGLVAAAWYFIGSPFGMAPLYAGLIVAAILVVGCSFASKEAYSPSFIAYKKWLAMAEQRDFGKISPKTQQSLAKIEQYEQSRG